MHEIDYAVQRMLQRAPEEIVQTGGGATTVADLRARCSVIEPGIVLVREAPHSTAEVFEIFMDAARSLGEPFGRYVIVNDLTDAKTRPKRQHLDVIINALNTVGIHWAVVQPGSIFLRTVARFIVARVSRVPGRVSVHEDMTAALAAARNALNKPLRS